MKSFLTLILLALPFGLSAQIPNTSTVVVEVTANVLVSATTKMPTIQTLYDINFVVYDEYQTQIVVDPIRNTVSTEDGAGAILITGTPNTEFTLRYTRFVEMKNEDYPTSTLTVEYILSHHPTDNQSSSTYINQLDTKFKLNGSGEYYIWVGGRVSITDIKDGQYLGGLEIEVSYDQN
jgi:opacity protein-like surface antigen